MLKTSGGALESKRGLQEGSSQSCLKTARSSLTHRRRFICQDPSSMMPLFSSPLFPFWLGVGALPSVPVSLVPSRASFGTFLAFSGCPLSLPGGLSRPSFLALLSCSLRPSFVGVSSAVVRVPALRPVGLSFPGLSWVFRSLPLLGASRCVLAPCDGSWPGHPAGFSLCCLLLPLSCFGVFWRCTSRSNRRRHPADLARR